MLSKTQSQNNPFLSKIMLFTAAVLLPSAALAETISVSGITFNTTTPTITTITLTPSNGSQGATLNIIGSQTGVTSQKQSEGAASVWLGRKVERKRCY